MKKCISLWMACVMAYTITCSWMPIYAQEADESAGTSYYVSSMHGDDNNDGTSSQKPFQTLDKINALTLHPGDQVLLEKGSTFENQFLHIKGSGDKLHPIQIASYGQGDKPQIHTNGKGVWYQDYGKSLDNPRHKYQGNVSSSILLNDVEYIEIRDLEITNDREKGIDDADKGLAYNDLNVMNRTGVAVYTRNIGTADHIVLEDLYIHDVDGNVYDKHMLNGGIYFITALPENEAKTGISKYDDIQIRNNYLDTVNRWGIAVSYTAYCDRFHTAEIDDATIQTYGATNVVIENNYIKDAGGDAITTMYCDRPLIQNNVSDGAARQINPTDYSQTDFGRVAAAIWPWKCKDPLFQYNECFNTKPNQDGQAWDADWGDGVIYQFNYSHNNAGGAVMFCGQQAIHNTFRYNISQNDLSGVINNAGNPDAHIYNNVFYIKEGVPFTRKGMSGGGMVVENNIIYNSAQTPSNDNSWYRDSRPGPVRYDNNLYYNYNENNLPQDEHAIKVDTQTDVFVDPGSAPTEPKAQIHERSAFARFKLAENSPAINAGKVITDANGKTIEKDFFGEKIGSIPEVDAAESPLVTLRIRSNTYEIKEAESTISGIDKNATVKTVSDNLIFDSAATLTFIDENGNNLSETDKVIPGTKVKISYQNEDRIYQIVGKSDCSLKETVYMVKDSDIYVPSTEENPTTIQELKQNIITDESATVSVWKDNVKILEGNVQEGMTLRITAENKTYKDYPVHIKNQYQWALDYAGPQQGNVWFGQIRKSLSEYETLQAYDPVYPNWVVDTYFGPGVDLANHTIVPNETTHGLLSDTTGPSRAQGMAMAFRAPKTGVLSVSLKEDEPYLPQNGNTNGSVIVKLTKNGEEIQRCVLQQSRQKSDFPTVDNLEVQKGDYVRIETQNEGNPTRASVHVTPTILYLNEKPLDRTPPSIPAELKASDVTSNSMTINWKEAEDKEGIAGYNLYVNGTLQNKQPIQDTSFALNNLDADTEYTVKVIAIDTSQNESDAAELQVRTLKEADTTPPSIPAELKASDVTSNSMTINWKEAEDKEGIAGYNLYLNGTLQNKEPIQDTSFALNDLNPDTEYRVRIEVLTKTGKVLNYVESLIKTDKVESKQDSKSENDLKESHQNNNVSLHKQNKSMKKKNTPSTGIVMNPMWLISFALGSICLGLFLLKRKR